MDLRHRLLSQSSVLFGARVIGAALIFLAQAGIARFWGAEVLGEYLLIIATVNIVAVVMPLGFETIGTYFAAEYRARGEGRLLRGFIGRAYGHVAVAAVLLVVFAYPLTAWAGEAGIAVAAHWVPACIMALATATVLVNSALLVGLKRPLAGFLADTIFRPMLIIGAFGVATLFVSADAALNTMIWALAVGFALIAFVQFIYVLLTAREVPMLVEPRPRESRRWWRFAMPWVLIALASDFFFDIDLLLLSGILSREELAIFGVCTRVFSLISFGVASVYAVTLPDMFESEAKSDRAGFHRKIGDANLVATGLALVLLAAVAIGSPLLLMLFGPAFLAGVTPLAVLCVALVIRSALGPAALVLSIHDRPYASLPAIGLGIVTLIGANFVLATRFGILGASLAALLAIIVWSAALWYTALRTAGVDVSIFARLRRPPGDAGERLGIVAGE